MKLAPKAAAAAAAVLALAGTGTAAGTALAASHGGGSPVPVAAAEPAGPDHDSIQQGDQASPDSSAALTAAGAPSPEPSSAEGESTAENSPLPPDGPGGHADAAGSVQYEFSGAQ